MIRVWDEDQDLDAALEQDKAMCTDLALAECDALSPYGREFIQSRLNASRATFLHWHALTLCEGPERGFVIFSRESASGKGHKRRRRCSYIEIFWLSLAPGLRGKGLGKRLLDAAIAKGRELWPEVTEARLHVMLNNPHARGFYESRGFKEQQRKKDYPEAGYTSFRMTLLLDDVPVPAAAAAKAVT